MTFGPCQLRKQFSQTGLHAFVTLTISIWTILFFSAFLDSASSLNQKGNELYEEKKYQSALDFYRKAQVKKPEQPEILYNIGTTLYQNGQFTDAAHELEKSISYNNKQKKLLSRNWYNYGNSQYRLGQFDNAIESYKKTLDLNPSDRDAKHNLELLLKKQIEFEKKQEERNQNREQKEQQDQQKRQDQSEGGSGQEQQKQQRDPRDQEQDDQSGREQKDETTDQESGREDEDEQPGDAKQQQDLGPQESEGQEQSQRSREIDQQEEQKMQSPEETAEREEHHFQGQMSKEEAYRILDALRESEKGLQIQRRPKPKVDPQFIEQDW